MKPHTHMNQPPGIVAALDKVALLADYSKSKGYSREKGYGLATAGKLDGKSIPGVGWIIELGFAPGIEYLSILDEMMSLELYCKAKNISKNKAIALMKEGGLAGTKLNGKRWAIHKQELNRVITLKKSGVKPKGRVPARAAAQVHIEAALKAKGLSFRFARSKKEFSNQKAWHYWPEQWGEPVFMGDTLQQALAFIENNL